MGDGDAAVVDAGPAIHLGEIGCLDVLDIFAARHVPEAVWRETVGAGRIDRSELERPGLVRHRPSRATVTRWVRRHELEAMHLGERECLYLCARLPVQLLLTDDLAVRDAARRLGVTPVGSLGVVVRASRLGRISLDDAESRILALHDVSTLFVTRAIVEMAVRELRQGA